MPTIQQFEDRFQSYLEKLKTVEYTRLNQVYGKIGKLITEALNELDGDISTLRRAQLNAFLGGVAKKQKAALDKMTKDHMDTLRSFSGYSYQMEASLMASEIGSASILHSTTSRAILQAALARPLGATGDLLEPFVKNLSASQTAMTQKILRKAHVNGWTTQQTVRVMRGTKKAGYADGLMSRLGKQTATVVRTSMQHVNNSARQTLWGDNADIITGYRWMSTLDDRTSEECQDLDGEEFKIGEGPVPPAHPNCRSTTVAVLDKAFDILDEGATRSSIDGYVPFDLTYEDWLAEQEE